MNTETTNAAPARIVVVDAMPEGLVLTTNDIVIVNAEDQIAAVRAFIRSKILKQFGVNGIGGQNVSTANLGFNADGVSTSLKLPKVTRNINGEIVETLEGYHKRCLPAIRTWFKDSIHNAHITVAAVEKMD